MQGELFGVGRKFLGFALVLVATVAMVLADKIPHLISLEQWGIAVGVLYGVFVGGNAAEKFAGRKKELPAGE